MLKRNIVANNLGQGWRVITLLIAVPLYIEHLGIEAYGLIAVFAMMQVWLGLLDLGLRPVLMREMARFTAGGNSNRFILELLRSIEIITFGVSCVVVISIWLASDWLAANWLSGLNLQLSVIAHSFILMGGAISLRFIEGIYSSSLAGLQRQVLQNSILIVVVTFQNIGVIGVLIWISPTIEMFFLWQVLLSIITVITFRVFLYRSLPYPQQVIHFSWQALASVWHFAVGMIGITFLGILVTQADKILASHLLMAEMFSYYAIAGLVASGLDLFTGPIAAAVYPHFVELHTRENEIELCKIYHKTVQFIAVFSGSLASILVVFPERVLVVWTSNSLLSQEVAPIMSLMVVGALAHCMLWIPYQLQLAYGWVSLNIKLNTIGVIFFIPLLLYLAPLYGAIGMAWAWVALNICYLVIGAHFMYRRILTNEKLEWYLFDMIIPITSSFLVTLVCAWLMPTDLNRVGDFFVLVGSLIIATIFSVLVSPLVRRSVWGNILLLYNFRSSA